MTVANNNTFTFDLDGVLAQARKAYQTYRDAVRAEEEARQQAAQEASERDIGRFYEWLNAEMGPELAALVKIPQGFRWDDLNYFWSNSYGEHKRGVQFAIDLPGVMPVQFRVYRSSRDVEPEFVTLDKFGQDSKHGFVWSVPTRVDFESGEEEDEIWPTYSAPAFYERGQLMEAVGHALTTKPFVECAMAEFKEHAAMPAKSEERDYEKDAFDRVADALRDVFNSYVMD